MFCFLDKKGTQRGWSQRTLCARSLGFLFLPSALNSGWAKIRLGPFKGKAMSSVYFLALSQSPAVSLQLAALLALTSMQTTRTNSMPVEEKAMPLNEKFLSAAEVEDSACPSWGGWKVWFTIATAEFAIIIILAVGMAHFALHGERGQNSTDLPDRGMLTSLQRINQTLEDATKRLEACQSNTRMLEANSSTLRLEMTKLNASLHLKESKNHILQEEVMLLRNWTHRLQNLNNQQKEIIDRFHQQKERLSCSSGSNLYLHRGPISLVLLTLAGMLWV